MADKSDQKEPHEGNKNVSENEAIEEPEETEEETPESPEKEKINAKKLKPYTLFKAILFLLLIGLLSWSIYYLHNIIQNNLTVTHKIEETIQGINRIQVEQDKIKKAFQNNISNNSPEKIFSALNKLSKKVSVLQDEVKVLQVEIKNQPKPLPPQQTQVDEISPEKTHPAKVEAREEPEVKETPEINEEPVVKKEPNTDVRNKAINLIENSVKIIFKTIGNAFEWIKGKVI